FPILPPPSPTWSRLQIKLLFGEYLYCGSRFLSPIFISICSQYSHHQAPPGVACKSSYYLASTYIVGPDFSAPSLSPSVPNTPTTKPHLESLANQVTIWRVLILWVHISQPHLFLPLSPILPPPSPTWSRLQ